MSTMVEILIDRIFEDIVETIREPLLVLDSDLKVILANESFINSFRVTPEETLSNLIYDLGNKQWDIPKLRELLENILPQQTSFDNYEVEHDFATIGRRIMLLNARQIERAWGKERIILLAIEDITERRQLEDLLSESEMRYRRIFETASDGIVLLEKDKGNVVQANAAIEKMLGYSEAEYVGKKLQDIGVPLDTSDFSAIMRDLDKNGILNFEDVQVKTKFGQTIDTDIYMVDRAKLAQCNIRDVSERKRIAEALKEETTFIKNALDSLQDIFFVFDLEGRFIRWNNTLPIVTGYLDTEIELMKPVDLFRDDDIRRIAEAIQTATKEGRVTVDAQIVTKDGRQIPYAFSASLLRNAQGIPVAISGVGRDITEQKQTETDLQTALMQAHEGVIRWEAIMTSMGGGLSIQDTDFAITYQNQFLKDFRGVHIGEHCYTAYENIDRVCEGCPIAMAYRDGGVHRAERTATAGGETIHVEITASPLRDMQGNIVAGIELIRDVTEQKKLEAQLRHAQKMEGIGTLAGGIAHDFNNILNVIMGYGAMVMDTLAADSQSKNDMHEVLIAADRAANLTKRLLTFSRKQPVEVKLININELIVGLHKMLLRMIRESIDFHLDLADMPLIVLADAGQMEQVLINLVVNAKDAMLEGGRLTIGTGLEEIDEETLQRMDMASPEGMR